MPNIERMLYKQMRSMHKLGTAFVTAESPESTGVTASASAEHLDQGLQGVQGVTAVERRPRAHSTVILY